MKSIIKHTFALCRLPVAAMTGFSALAGCLLASSRSFSFSLGVALAVSFLAAGASALNQVQERDIDSRMERTRVRPIPSGALSPGRGLAIAIAAILLGIGGLSSFGAIPFALGIAALVWYNGVYTPLKRVTAFAAVPGALVGMVPPGIGWTAAGGSLLAPRLLIVCFFFFLWQVPHFWLQILHHGEEYDRAGVPSLSALLGKSGVCRLTYAWICAAAVSAFLLPLYGSITSPRIYFFLVPAAVILMATGSRLLVARDGNHARSAFQLINGYLLLVMSLLSIEGLLRMP